MRGGYAIVLGVAGLWMAAGCRTASRVIEAPRVDLDLSHGNRGYLVGTPPPVTESPKTTRQMVETEIEIPDFGMHRAASGPGGVALSGERPEQPSPPTEPQGPEQTYEVKRGDSLSSIAARPEIFGDASQWRRLFEANRDVLSDPNRLRPGTTLQIPRRSPARRTQAREAGTYTK